MKILSILVILCLTLSSCSVYKGREATVSLVKYEYRCVEDVCKDVEIITYKKGALIPKNKYKHLSKEELENKEKKIDEIRKGIVQYSFLLLFIGIPVSVGINAGVSSGWTVLGVEYGVILAMYVGALFLSASQEKKCNKEGEDRYYDRSCYTKPPKPEENKKSNEVIKAEPLPASQ